MLKVALNTITLNHKIIKKQAYNRKYLDVRAAHKRLYNKGVHIVVSLFKIVVAP
jgi:N-acetylmuramic acid 6-phosphate (MurNAc-6-P) etherase